MKTGTGWTTSAVKNSENICEQAETKKALPRRAGFAAEDREAGGSPQPAGEAVYTLRRSSDPPAAGARIFRAGTQAVSAPSSEVQWGHLVASAGISLLQ